MFNFTTLCQCMADLISEGHVGKIDFISLLEYYSRSDSVVSVNTSCMRRRPLFFKL